MTAAMRRGACPSLAAPMATGDGLLVRLALPELTPAQLAGLARAAERLGNGRIEVTGRGSLQIRGLTKTSAPALAEAIAALGIVAASGPPVLTGPLAGLDPTEIADPRPLAAALRGFRGPLQPKVSVVVDGGGVLHLDAVAADVRVRATTEGWLVGTGARALGCSDAAGAVRAALGLLELLSARNARARDPSNLAPEAGRPAANPIGRFALVGGRLARGFGLPFGQVGSAALAAFATAAAEAEGLRPAPGRALVAVGLSPEAERDLTAAARRLGFVADASDPRLSVVACSGAPACASAHMPTRALAEAVVARPDLLRAGLRLHVSGCAKRCAQPSGPAVTLLGTPDGCEVTGEGVAVPAALRAFLLERAR